MNKTLSDYRNENRQLREANAKHKEDKKELKAAVKILKEKTNNDVAESRGTFLAIGIMFFLFGVAAHSVVQ